MNFRSFSSLSTLSRVVSIVVLGACGVTAQGQGTDFPDKPIKLVVPFSAGSGTDQLARALGQAAAEISGQTVVVENKAGGAGVIAAKTVISSAPDGYTLFMGGTTTHAANVHLYRDLGYDPEKDFVPITALGRGWQVLVANADLPVSNVPELISYITSRDGQANFASGSSGSRVAGEAFKQMAGLDMVNVPYKGNPLAITDVISGRVEMMVADTGTVLPHVHSGRVKALGVTNTNRSPLLPDIPPLNEAGVPGYDVSNFFALYAPAGVPGDVIEKLNALFVQAAQSDTARKGFYEVSGTEVFTTSSEELRAYQQEETKKYGEIIKAAGIEPQ